MTQKVGIPCASWRRNRALLRRAGDREERGSKSCWGQRDRDRGREVSKAGHRPREESYQPNALVSSPILSRQRAGIGAYPGHSA